MKEIAVAYGIIEEKFLAEGNEGRDKDEVIKEQEKLIASLKADYENYKAFSEHSAAVLWQTSKTILRDWIISIIFSVIISLFCWFSRQKEEKENSKKLKTLIKYFILTVFSWSLAALVLILNIISWTFNKIFFGKKKKTNALNW